MGVPIDDVDKAEELVEDYREMVHGAVVSGVEYGLIWDDIIESAEKGDLERVGRFVACIEAKSLVRDDYKFLAQHPIDDVETPEGHDVNDWLGMSEFAVDELLSVILGLQGRFPGTGEPGDWNEHRLAVIYDEMYSHWNEVRDENLDGWYDRL